MAKAKSKAGRKFKPFGFALSENKSFSVTKKEDAVITALCLKLDLPEARLFRQIIFGISKHIEIPKES